MVTRIKVLFAIIIFALTTFISNAIFGANGSREIHHLQEDVDRLHQLESKISEEVGLLRRNASHEADSDSQHSFLVLSFDEGDVYQPQSSEAGGYDISSYEPLPGWGSLLVGLGAVLVYSLILLIVGYIKRRGDERRDNRI